MTAVAQDKKPSTRVVTPVALLSFPHLFVQWRGVDGTQKPKFSATFVFAPGIDLREMKAAAITAARNKWGPKADDMIRTGKLRMPFRQDGEQFGYPEGSIFVGAVNYGDIAPGVVSRYKDPVTGKAKLITAAEQNIGNSNEMYPGCQVRGLLGAFGYDNQSKGVSFGLNGIQRIGEGTRLDNRVAPEDAFEADLSEAPAAIEDITGGQGLEDLM